MSPDAALSGEAPPAAVSPGRIRVGFIVGPTGVGKTAFAMAAAHRLDAEIVNADSRQLYRGMDLGTAKPSAAERRQVAHHLIDIRDPNEPLDVARFARIAGAAIAEIAGRGRRVLVAGGSGLYLRVLRGGIFNGPAARPAIRAELMAVAERLGSGELYRRLGAVDPEAAARVDRHDLRRIVRALEVYQSSGITISAYQRRHAFAAREYASLTIGLTITRAALYAAIERRFDAMVAAGLVDEVRALMAGGGEGGASLSAIGYREIAAYLRSEMTLEQAVERAKRESRRLAKRQLTWFRAEPEIVWIDPREQAEEGIRRLASFFAHAGEERDG
jgi:tRNA dimethylallyltransferase